MAERHECLGKRRMRNIVPHFVLPLLWGTREEGNLQQSLYLFV